MKSLRLPLLLLKISFIAIVAWGLALYPGKVQIEWLGYRLRTGVEILIAAILLFSAVMVTISMLYKWLKELPGRINKKRSESKKIKADQTILHALSAIAAGDGVLADKLVRKAKSYNSNMQINNIVDAQAAHIRGDEEAAHSKFSKLIENKQTEFLGLRGLILQAQAKADWAQMHNLLEKALNHFPKSPWLLEQLYFCNLQLSSYGELTKLIESMKKYKLIDAKTAERRHALLLWLNAESIGKQNPQNFIKQAERALKTIPENIHISLEIAKSYIEIEEKSKAFKVLKATFIINPHHELLELMKLSFKNNKTEAFYAELKRLVDKGPTNSEGLFCLAKAALSAKLWGEARTHLEQMIKLYPAKRAFALFAQLESQEFPEEVDRQAKWLSQISNAASDPTWQCSSCKHEYSSWLAICNSCKTLGSINWRSAANNSIPLKQLTAA